MHPDLFEIQIPSFLRSFLPDSVVIHSYGFLIALGALAGFYYTAYQAKRQLGMAYNRTATMFNIMILSSIIGGKVFFYLENPSLYIESPKLLIENFGSGFVFYGAMLFAVPSLIFFFKRNKLPSLKMFDIVAVMLCILHAFGRMGCFMAGCCHGKPYDGIWAITFTNPNCAAEPLNTPLYPTQLYSVFMILTILAILLIVQRKKKFDGQLGLTYLALYAIGRSIIEVFRGDEERGFIIGNYISHSQFISVLILSFAIYFYIKLYRKSKKIKPNE